jgi:hypothetical protein
MPLTPDSPDSLATSSPPSDPPDRDGSDGDGDGDEFFDADATSPPSGSPISNESNGGGDGAAEETLSSLVGGGIKGEGADRPTAGKKKAKMSSKQKQKMKKKCCGGAAEEKAVVGRTLTIILGNEAQGVQTVVMNCNRHVVRDVATAAGVNWGREDPPLRMQELQKRHAGVVAIAEQGILTLVHLRDHNEVIFFMAYPNSNSN